MILGDFFTRCHHCAESVILSVCFLVRQYFVLMNSMLCNDILLSQTRLVVISVFHLEGGKHRSVSAYYLVKANK